MTFASQIEENGFNNSQLEIDDRWESCYGEQTFDNKKFSDPKQMNDQLHNLVKWVISPYYLMQKLLIFYVQFEKKSFWQNRDSA